MEAAHTDLATRRQVALERAGELVTRADARSNLAWKSYYTLQTLTVALAAITPCLIFLAKDNHVWRPPPPPKVIPRSLTAAA